MFSFLSKVKMLCYHRFLKSSIFLTSQCRISITGKRSERLPPRFRWCERHSLFTNALYRKDPDGFGKSRTEPAIQCFHLVFNILIHPHLINSLFSHIKNHLLHYDCSAFMNLCQVMISITHAPAPAYHPSSSSSQAHSSSNSSYHSSSSRRL